MRGHWRFLKSAHAWQRSGLIRPCQRKRGTKLIRKLFLNAIDNAKYVDEQAAMILKAAVVMAKVMQIFVDRMHAILQYILA